MKKPHIYILILIITTIPWVVYFILFHNYTIEIDNNTWSQFGGYIGGVSTSLTLPITLVFVYKAYLSQKKVEVLNIETNNLNKFNSYFFELIKCFNQYRFEQMKLWRKIGTNEKEWIYGMRFFLENRRIFQKYSNEGFSDEESYNKIIESHNLSFEYYFRTLNSLFEWIENGDINKTQKERYHELIINSLTNDEKFFIKNFNYIQYDWNLNLLKKESNKLNLNFNYK